MSFKGYLKIAHQAASDKDRAEEFAAIHAGRIPAAGVIPGAAGFIRCRLLTASFD
jgi:hypothetical protein